MTAQPNFFEMPQLNALARAASELGYEIVDIAGFLDLIEIQAREQRAALSALENGADDIETVNSAVQSAATDLGHSVTRTAEDVEHSAHLMCEFGNQSREVAAWVQDLSDRTGTVGETLKAVKTNNAQITKNIETLTDWIARLRLETQEVSHTAAALIEHSNGTDASLTRMEQSVSDTQVQTGRIGTQTGKVRSVIEAFSPDLRGIGGSINTTASGVEQAHDRVQHLINKSETIVQSSAALGGMTDDAPFITYARDRASAIAAALEQAVAEGRISEVGLFDTTYVPIPGTMPQQVRTAYVDLFDQILPPLQEPALAFDSKVVFCAAVDVNGYLPTHNHKFSQPPRDDVVWNTAHYRNRRIFDDRVGLKAGRSTAPFLLQVYRRDMGGGAFKMMKDLSAPIMVRDRHWGGLRLAYTF